MDHTRDLRAHQPWRSAAIVAAAVATVELCILLVLGGLAVGEFFAGEVEKAQDPVTVARAAGERETAGPPAKRGSGKDSKALLPRDDVSVLVLNGNGIAGAASTAAERVHARNYVVAGTGNAPRSDFARSVVMYRPGLAGEARRLARDVGVRRVAPLDGLQARDLQGAHVALVIGG